MSKLKFQIGLLLGILAAWCSWAAYARVPESAKSPIPPKIHWRSDLDQARAEAVRTARPMLIVFGAEWCGYCEKMQQSCFTDPTLTTYVNHAFVPVYLDLDRHFHTAEILEIDRVPCSVALSPEADLLGRIVGYINPEKYRESLSKIRQLHERVRRERVVGTF